MNTHIPPESLYLTVEQVAQRYGVSVDSIWRWKRDGRFPKAYKLTNGTTRWRFDDLLDHEASLSTCCVIDIGDASGLEAFLASVAAGRDCDLGGGAA